MALYDPREFPTETKVGADFTLADVLAWARTKPADESYTYYNYQQCAVCQFLRETGRAAIPNVGPEDWYDEAASKPASRPLDRRIDCAADEGEWTFGAFASRLEKAMAR